MTFLNGILAFGAIAALVPLLIHLLNRSRFKVVAWGAIHLLESVLRKNRRQIQLEQIILLIIRCIIPILLALALARMVVTEWGPFLNRIILPLVALGFLIMVALLPRARMLGELLCMCIAYISWERKRELFQIRIARTPFGLFPEMFPPPLSFC